MCRPKMRMGYPKINPRKVQEKELTKRGLAHKYVRKDPVVLNSYFILIKVI
ncbi:hypothetical protein GGR27_001512 [Lewinella antarctica]|uniref:Uncharacterized protein n=1 Tax=Neolewinella antarctica TaxID=442734 RepID=A0ABX0XB07_9BACT|nr:hypothetical protein [Neolewinella antarctica]